MESERKWSVEMLRGEQEEEHEDVLSEGLEELEFSVTDDDEVDEGQQGSTPLIDVFCENLNEVSVCWSATGAVWELSSLFLRMLSADGVTAADGPSRCDSV